MKATTLKDWLINNFSLEPVLTCWAAWQNMDTPRLGYKTMLKGAYHTKTIWLSEDELMLVDKTLCKVKQENNTLFKTILMRFVDHNTYQDIARNLGFTSPSAGQAKVIDAVKSFAEKLEKAING